MLSIKQITDDEDQRVADIVISPGFHRCVMLYLRYPSVPDHHRVIGPHNGQLLPIGYLFKKV